MINNLNLLYIHGPFQKLWKIQNKTKLKKQQQMYVGYLPYEFQPFAYPLTLCVINNGLIFFLHFFKKMIYFFLGKGAFLITYQKNTSLYHYILSYQ